MRNAICCLGASAVEEPKWRRQRKSCSGLFPQSHVAQRRRASERGVSIDRRGPSDHQEGVNVQHQWSVFFQKHCQAMLTSQWA